MNHYVYEITNLVNGKKYIGKRSCKCAIEDDKYMGSGKLIKKAHKKYGINNFRKDILEVCNTEEDAYNQESYYIDNVYAYSNKMYYNIAKGGGGGFYRMCAGKSNEEINEILSKIKSNNQCPIRRKRLSESLMGRVFSDTHKSNLSKANIGKRKGVLNNKSSKIVLLNTLEIFDCIQDAARKYNLSSSGISRACASGRDSCYYGIYNNEKLVWEYYYNYINMNNDDIMLKISKATKYLSGENHPRSKKIINLNTMVIYNTITEASNEYNISTSHICDCCNGNRITAAECVWMYLEDYRNITKQEVDIIMHKAFGKYKIISINTKTIYKNIKEASDELGIDNSSIRKHLKGKLKSAGKINGEPARWMYYDDYLKQKESNAS